MQEKHLYEYAVLRVVPRVEREEFVNVGVILYCKSKNFLQVVHHLDPQRVAVLYKEADAEEISAHLASFYQICCGGSDAGPIAQLDLSSRFRWLTAVRSTVLQTSRVHPGFCDDPEQELQRLFGLMVL